MLQLSTLRDSLPEIIEVSLGELRSAPPSELGEHCERLCTVFRAAAASALFIDFDPDDYRHMLIRSGRTRLFLLEKSSDSGKSTSRFCKISRSNGFLDSVAAGDRQVARAIVDASPKSRNERFEYEDDFAYARALHGFVLEQGDEIRTSLDLLGAALEQPTARLAVCLALEAGDPESFEEAFERLLSTRRAELVAEERSASRDEMSFVSARHLFVEGLALLQLADWRDIATRQEYELCPREARIPMNRPFPGDLHPC